MTEVVDDTDRSFMVCVEWLRTADWTRLERALDEERERLVRRLPKVKTLITGRQWWPPVDPDGTVARKFMEAPPEPREEVAEYVSVALDD